MSELDLPQSCSRCHKWKASKLGQFFWSKTRYHTRVWVCDECLSKPRVLRLARPGQETPPELEVRRAIERTGIRALAEFSMDRFIFDFAIPSLRMLIEVDSPLYHRQWNHVRNDRKKDEWATQNRWHLVRIRPPDLSQQVVHAITMRAQSVR